MQGPLLAEYDYDGLCTPGQPAPFWVQLDATGLVSGGLGSTPGANVIMSYLDPTPIDAKYFDLGEWDAQDEYTNVQWSAGTTLLCYSVLAFTAARVLDLLTDCCCMVV